MNADAQQLPIAVGAFFAVVGVAVCAIVVGLLIEGEIQFRRSQRECVTPHSDRFDVYGTDDDEPVQRPVEPGCCPMHDAARARVRRFAADRALVEFDPDAELAELLRGGQ